MNIEGNLSRGIYEILQNGAMVHTTYPESTSKAITNEGEGKIYRAYV
jgi:hypothetical protein